MVKIDIDELETELKKFKRSAFPFATKETLNQMAFHASRLSKERIGKEFVNRNKFTKKSVRFEKTQTLNVNKQESAVGSTESYMAVQESGGVRRTGGKHGVPIPTSYSAGQGRTSERTRLPRRENQITRIRMNQRKFKSLGKNRKQRLVVSVLMAVNRGDKYVYLEFKNNRKGIARIVGGRKGVRRGWPGNAKLQVVHDLSHDVVRIPRHLWMGPSVGDTRRLFPDIYRKALMFQLRRHRIIV